MTLRRQIIAAVRARMKALGLTQRQLAKKLGTSQPHVARLLSGKHTISVDMVGRLAKALRCEAEFRLLSTDT